MAMRQESELDHTLATVLGRIARTVSGTLALRAVSYTHLTLPTNREV